jgi:multiple sugar transport system ATP-binding protein
MNFFDVSLDVASDGSGTLVGDGFEYAVSKELVDTVDAGTGEYILAVRPENFRVDEDAPVEKSFEATVDVVEVIGSDNFLYLDLAGQECRVRTPVEIEPEIGDTVRVTFDEADLHLFDRDTEEAVVHGHNRAEEAPQTIEQQA